MNPIQGSIVALVTPMQADGSDDNAAQTRLSDRHIAERTDSSGVDGTTAESPTTISCTVAVPPSAKRKALPLSRAPAIAGMGYNTAKINVLTMPFKQHLRAWICILSADHRIFPTFRACCASRACRAMSS